MAAMEGAATESLRERVQDVRGLLRGILIQLWCDSSPPAQAASDPSPAVGKGNSVQSQRRGQ